jgi:uncharacterized protein (TIGR03118 family)
VKRFQSKVIVRFGVLCACVVGSGASFYREIDLVSDLPGHGTVDPNLVNPWGLAFSPTGFGWVINTGTGTATSYDGNGNPQLPVVMVPGGAAAAPTGIVYNGSTSFVISSGRYSGPSQYIFAGEDGRISAWSAKVPPRSTNALTVVDNSAKGAVYKGLGMDTIGGNPYLYAPDFHNNRIDVFDSSFHPITFSGGFVDPAIPAGYAPFNVQNINGLLYVAYAMQDRAGHDDVRGLGHGYVDVFDASGNLLKHLISGGVLNSPWGLAMAPANFGAFSNSLLVGNFGDGLIHAFDPNTGSLLGTLSSKNGLPIRINGLWALEFGNGAHGQGTNQLFFTAGIQNEAHGLYGKITAVTTPASANALVVPEPSSLVLAALSLGLTALWGVRRPRIARRWK